ncbi:hypothetical protein [Streptomyces sp. NPDC000983]|uniref:hypothetical protein n=1 Tax=Streptomyces sp. NPDC000983 TaxID=3154373 RepID=UPI00331F2D3A
MAERDWDDDSGYRAAVRQAERAARFGWAAIGTVVGGVGCAVIAAALVAVAVVVGMVTAVVSSHY